jgi:hypothetical protein
VRFLCLSHRTRSSMRRYSTDDALPPLVASPPCCRAGGATRLLISLLTAVVLCMSGAIRLRAAPPPLLPAAPRAAVISGVTMGLDETNASRVRLRFEVCGPDVTQMPGAGLPVTFGFDMPILRVAVHSGRTSLTLGVHVTGPMTTVSVQRDPFTPPEPWRLVILIDVAQMPTAGGITIGTWPAHDLTPGLAVASRQVRVVVGTGCDDLHAGQESSRAGAWRLSFPSREIVRFFRQTSDANLLFHNRARG